MIVESEKFVDLCDGHYIGFWSEYFVTIPFVGEDLDIPVSGGNPSVEAMLVHLNIVDNQFNFEVNE